MANAWLVIAAGEDRQHGGNDGYEDDPASTYRWDSTVPNHAAVAAGDTLAVWDKRALIGASVVERINEDSSVKTVYRCSHCGRAHIKRRKSLQPAWRCFACASNFDSPLVESRPVRTYASQHEVGWVDLGGVLNGSELRQLCDSSKSQLSIRRLNWSAFRAAIEAVLPGEPLTVLESRVARLRGGYVRATVRVRRGQAAFRQRLLEKQGPQCAITGPAPVEALEAGHLYSYADVGHHHEQGGLLLRRDVHRLFDLGQIAVHPESLTLDVRPGLAGYEQYAALQGRPLVAPLTPAHRRWVSMHWRQHRGPASQAPG